MIRLAASGAGGRWGLAAGAIVTAILLCEAGSPSARPQAPGPGAAAETGPVPSTSPPTGSPVASPRVALFPIQNLSGVEAPIDNLRGALRARLAMRGIPFVDDAALREFMRRNRVRYVGGLDTPTAHALRTDLGADAALIVSLDLYQEVDPPKVGVTARLVSGGEAVRILWMDSYASAGDEAPGFLGLGLIGDVDRVESSVMEHLGDSLVAALKGPGGAGGAGAVPRGVAHRFQPRTFFSSPRAAIAKRPIRAAVLPFDNESTTRHAADLVSLQIVRRLHEAGAIEVIEPGVVREAMLRSRLIQEEGPSVPQADLLRINLDADIVVSGRVTQYVEAWAGAAEPQVDFLVQVMDTHTRQAVVVADSRARGDDGVFFFGLGRLATAHELAAEMVRALIGKTVVSLEGES